MDIRSYASNGTCVTYLVHPAISAGILVFSGLHHHVFSGVPFIQCVPAVCYDFLVLILSIVKLSKRQPQSPLMERLRTQGLLYFAIAAAANILPMVWIPRTTLLVKVTYSSFIYRSLASLIPLV